MEQGKREMYEKEFKRAEKKVIRAMVELDEMWEQQRLADYQDKRCFCNYWNGVMHGLLVASDIEKEYDLKQCKDRIKSVKEKIREGMIAEIETDPNTDLATRIKDSLEKDRERLKILKDVKRKIKAEIESGNF